MKRMSLTLVTMMTLVLCPSLVAAGPFEEALTIVQDTALLAKDAPRARRLLKEAVALDSKHTHAWYNLGLLERRRGAMDTARDHWRKALAVDPAYHAAEARLAEADLGTERRNAAIIRLNKVIAAERFQPEARNALAQVAMEARDWKQAIVHSRNVLLGDPGNVNAYLNMAVAYYRQRFFDQSLLILDSGQEKAPRAASLHNLRGLIYLEKDNSRMASKSFLKAIEFDPAQLDALLNLGSLELSYGSFAPALVRFATILKQRPNDPMLLLSHAVALRGLGRFKEAEQGIAAAIALKPGWSEAYYNLCVLHYQFTSDYAAAKTSCGTYFKSLRRGHGKYREMRRRMKSIKETLAQLAEEAAGQAACVKFCEGRTCGEDPCGGSCGTCAEGQSCSEAGACATK